MCDDLTQPAPIDAVAKRSSAAYFDRMAQLMKDNPPPAAEFDVTTRMYWPNDMAPTIRDGSGKPPAVRKVK